MTYPISLNTDAKAVGNPSVLLDWYSRVKPSWGLIMDGVGLARQVKQASSLTNVIHRDYVGVGGDDDLHKKMQPDKWLDLQAKNIGNADLWVYACNEPGYDADIINWLCNLIETNARRATPLKLVIGNFSVGVPRNPDTEWPMARRLLGLLDQYRNWVILGLHEYWGAVVTSGFYGGWPDNAGIAPNPNAAPGTIGLNLIPQANWPASRNGITMFHCGRYQLLLNYCKSVGVNPPRMVLTEHGADSLGDIDGFLTRLRRTYPYQEIRGFKTLANQWVEWYPGKSLEQVYVDMLTYARRVIYSNSPVEGQLIYNCYNSDTKWGQFDISTHSAILDLLAKDAESSATPPPVVVEPPPPPVIPPEPPKQPVLDVDKVRAYVAAAQTSLNAVVELIDKSKKE